MVLSLGQGDAFGGDELGLVGRRTILCENNGRNEGFPGVADHLPARCVGTDIEAKRF